MSDTNKTPLAAVRQASTGFADARNTLRLAREAVEAALTPQVAAASTVDALRLIALEIPQGFGRFAPLFSKILTLEESKPSFGLVEGKTAEQLRYELYIVYEAYPEYHDAEAGSGVFEDMVQRFANDGFYKLHKVAQRYLELRDGPRNKGQP